jgi:CopG family transcriptional regulator / antitoxin EndoAI
MYRRINVTLPDGTLKLLDQFAPKGDRSSFIDEAIQSYIAQIQKKRLREQLKEGAIRRAERDRNLVSDWFELEEEVWQQNAQ